MDLLQRPPDRLDVGGVHRPVGLAHVDPVAHPLGHLLEEVDVPLHRLAAAGVELGDAVRLDVGLAGEAELLLDGELDRQAVAVPAGLAVDLVALHRLEAREDVLERPRLDVVGAGAAVRGGRALEEGPACRLPRCGPRTSRRSAARARSRARSRSRLGQVDLRGDGAVRAHCVPSASAVEHSIRRDEVAVAASPRYHPPWPADPARRPTSWATRVGLTAAGSSPQGPRERPVHVSSGGSGMMVLPSTPCGWSSVPEHGRVLRLCGRFACGTAG